MEFEGFSSHSSESLWKIFLMPFHLSFPSWEMKNFVYLPNNTQNETRANMKNEKKIDWKIIRQVKSLPF